MRSQTESPVARVHGQWRHIRVQLVKHIRDSDTWSDMLLGADALFQAGLLARDMIDEAQRSNPMSGGANQAAPAQPRAREIEVGGPRS